jgi:hypothetical protein
MKYWSDTTSRRWPSAHKGHEGHKAKTAPSLEVQRRIARKRVPPEAHRGP